MAHKRITRQLKPENIELIKAMKKRHPNVQWNKFNFTQTLLLARSLKELPGRFEHHLPWSRNSPAEKKTVIKQTYKYLSKLGVYKKGRQELFPISIKEASKLSMIMLIARQAAEHAGSSKQTPLNVRTFDKIKLQFRAEVIRELKADPKLRRQLESSSKSAIKLFLNSPNIDKDFKEKVKRTEQEREKEIKRRRNKKKAIKNTIKRRLEARKKFPAYKPKPGVKKVLKRRPRPR